MKPSKGIVHVTYNDFGPKDTVDLLDSLQNTVENFLVLNGFSVGISDLIADEDTKKNIDVTIQDKKKKVEEFILQVHMDLFDNNTGKTNQQEFEDQIFGILNQATADAGSLGQQSLSTENRLLAMVRSGSKGEPLNVAQMMACLGQTAIEGKRVPYGFTDRTLPHYKKYDDSSEARGFIDSSFIRGLTPQQFFFHAMSGREGLIDTAVKTADTGYIQRQLIKSMEDLTVQHDGTVRDANGNIVQFYYGEDGINPIKIETQSLSIGKLSEEEIRTIYGMKDADWGTMLEEGIIIDATVRDKLVTRYVQDMLNDQYMLVEGVLQKKAVDSGSIFAPVNLARYIHNIKVRCGLDNTKKTNLTQQIVLEGINRLIIRTRISNRDRYEMCQVCSEEHGATNKCLDCPHGKNEMCDVAAAEHCTKEGFERHRVVSLHEYHKIWAALLRFHLAPHVLIKEHGFTKEAFEMLMELILVNHMKAWVQPGDQVGIVAAQSIGEPATQMSSAKDSLIVLQNDKNLKYFGTVGEICDRILEENKDSVVTIGKDSVVLSLEDNYFIVGVSEDEKTSWKRISEISRHPANGGMIEVVTRSGRRTTATLTHSFLKRSTTGIVPVLGSDLQIGMRIPIARHVPEVPQPIMSIIQGDTIFDMDNEFGWVCGIYLADGSFNGNNVRITKIHPIVEEKLKAFATQYDMKFTTHTYQGKFGPGKDNNILSKDLKDFLMATFGTGSYEKHIGATAFHANKEFIAGLISGYFDGDGNVSVERQLIRASSRSKKLIENMTALLGYVGLFGTMSEETSVRMEDKVQHTLVILPKFAQDFKDKVGFRLTEKAEALDEIIAYNAREDVHAKPEAVDKIPELGAIIAQTGKLLQMPGQSRTYGRWAKKESIGRQTLEKYVMAFEEKLQTYDLKDPIHDAVKDNMAILKSAVDADVVWDEIVDLIYHDDPKEFVYDFTVPGNDSFMVDCNVLVHNTLNSVDWDTEIMVAKNGKILTPKIGEWIDQYYEEMLVTKKDCIQYHPNNQIYIPLEDGNDWKAISCDEDGNMKWTKLEAITRHPVVNEDGTNTILKVTLESGREVKATKGKSFLTLQHGKVLEINGSDLSVGDSLPIANHLALNEVGLITKVQLRDILPATEYLYGTDVHAAMEVMTTSSERHWFKKNQGVLFTLPYSRSDAFRDAFQHGRNSNEIRVKHVYNKHMKQNVSQIPETIDLTSEFGFFCGAYLAEGMSNETQVMITNNDAEYLNRVKVLMDEWNVGTHIVSTQKTIEKSDIKGLSTSLVIHSTILAKVMKTWFGRVSYEKNVPNWALQAPDSFLKGLMDGYICGDGTINKRSGTVHATSVSKQLIEGIQRILARFHVYNTMTSCMPNRGKFDSVSQCYTLTIPKKYSNVFASTFTLMISYKQETLNKHHMYREQDKMVSKWKTTNDVVWDKIKAIEEVAPMGEGWVYDITVEDTRNFMTNTLIALKDTFHQAGVASKSAVTRGVPRLRELLKVTQNPKATSLTIYLKPEYRTNKEKAREVVQDLELTLLHTITDKVAIYWDDTDKSTIIEEDIQLMNFYSQFENGPFDVADSDKQHLSKWVLRLELNREEMFNRNITMQEVVFIINHECGDSSSIVYSDYNSDKLIMRIRLPNKSDKSADKDSASTMDDLTNLKKFQNKLLNSIVIRGVPGIKDVAFHNNKKCVEMVDGKYQQVEQFVLDTNGSNFIKVMNHPMVDGTRVYSTNVWDVYEVLGIEATRATLFNEINGLFDSVGVNYRHLCLLCDVMTRSGQLMSIDRYGINKNDIGTLAKASFEETEKILLKAALFGEVDPVTGVSANIMMGQPIRGGTAFSQILLDDQMLVELLKNINIHEEANDEEELDIDFLQDASADVIGPCSRTQFHTSMILPEPKAAMDEADVELTILDD
jgi:DNA-directed RNA polymerase beta' subunit